MGIVENYAKYADKYASFATSFEQACQMRGEKSACKKEASNVKLAKKYEAGHVAYKKRMVNLKCYMYESQWKVKKAAKKKASKKASKKAPSPTPAPTPSAKKKKN